jgi:hypothetical protein
MYTGARGALLGLSQQLVCPFYPPSLPYRHTFFVSPFLFYQFPELLMSGTSLEFGSLAHLTFPPVLSPVVLQVATRPWFGGRCLRLRVSSIGVRYRSGYQRRASLAFFFYSLFIAAKCLTASPNEGGDPQPLSHAALY